MTVILNDWALNGCLFLRNPTPHKKLISFFVYNASRMLKVKINLESGELPKFIPIIFWFSITCQRSQYLGGNRGRGV